MNELVAVFSGLAGAVVGGIAVYAAGYRNGKDNVPRSEFVAHCEKAAEDNAAMHEKVNLIARTVSRIEGRLDMFFKMQRDG